MYIHIYIYTYTYISMQHVYHHIKLYHIIIYCRVIVIISRLIANSYYAMIVTHYTMIT